MGEWQPIETAPKDGTWILVFEKEQYDSGCYVVRWATPEWRGGGCAWVTIALGPNPDSYEVNATHWMPLPSPPTP